MVKYIDLKSVKKVSTRIRREYFDAIKAGEKDKEIRYFSEYWSRRFYKQLDEDVPTVLVLLCGKDVYRCEITAWRSVFGYDELIDILGREPSEQGLKDISTAGPWLVMYLGEEVRDKYTSLVSSKPHYRNLKSPQPPLNF